MNDLDTGAEKREADRYSAAVEAYANAAVKSENSLAWLNMGQSLITNFMLGAGMAVVAWVWVDREVHRLGRRIRINSAQPAVPAVRHARLGLSHDPPGRDRHGRNVRSDRHRRLR